MSWRSVPAARASRGTQASDGRRGASCALNASLHSNSWDESTSAASSVASCLASALSDRYTLLSASRSSCHRRGGQTAMRAACVRPAITAKNGGGQGREGGLRVLNDQHQARSAREQAGGRTDRPLHRRRGSTRPRPRSRKRCCSRRSGRPRKRRLPVRRTRRRRSESGPAGCPAARSRLRSRPRRPSTSPPLPGPTTARPTVNTSTASRLRATAPLSGRCIPKPQTLAHPTILTPQALHRGQAGTSNSRRSGRNFFR